MGHLFRKILHCHYANIAFIPSIHVELAMVARGSTWRSVSTEERHIKWYSALTSPHRDQYFKAIYHHHRDKYSTANHWNMYICHPRDPRLLLRGAAAVEHQNPRADSETLFLFSRNIPHPDSHSPMFGTSPGEKWAGVLEKKPNYVFGSSLRWMVSTRVVSL
jgi:hypothetical protein